jgi:uncharacterized membrane protein
MFAAAVIVRAERAFVYGLVMVPGAVFTNAQGINPGGTIVGFYRDGVNRTHGFVWEQGVVTTVDYRDAAGNAAVYTDARGISPGGEIVGTYRMSGEPAVNFHGYLLKKDGTFVNLDFPGHTNTIAQRILPDGTVLGCRHGNDTMATMRGIRIRSGESDEIDEFASMNNGATPDSSLIVGLFTNMMSGRGEGYVIEDGLLMSFVVPGSSQTAAWDVNPRGEIVGVYTDAAGVVHGFLRDDNEYVTLDVPGARATRAFGINPGGDVVGAFVDSANVTRAFVATRTRGHRR